MTLEELDKKIDELTELRKQLFIERENQRRENMQKDVGRCFIDSSDDYASYHLLTGVSQVRYDERSWFNTIVVTEHFDDGTVNVAYDEISPGWIYLDENCLEIPKEEFIAKLREVSDRLIREAQETGGPNAG